MISSLFSDKKKMSVKKTDHYLTESASSIRDDIAALRSMTEQLNAKDDELRRAKDEWEKTFDTIPDPLFVITVEGKIIQYNEAGDKILNIVAEDTSHSFKEIISIHNDKSSLEYMFNEKFIDEILEKQDSVEITLDIPELKQHYLIEGTPIVNSEKITESIIVILKNVSEISKIKFQLENVLKTSDAGYWEWYPFIGDFYGSSKFFEILDIPEFMKCSQKEFIGKISDIVHPDDLSFLLDTFNRVLRPDSHGVNLEFRVKANRNTEKGVLLDEYRWVFFRGNVVKESAEFTATRLAGIIFDINEMKKLIIQKEEVENLFKYVADTMLDMIWAKNLNGEFIFSNKMNTSLLLDPENLGLDPIGKTDAYFASVHALEGKKKGIPNYYTFSEMCTESDDLVLESKKPHRSFEAGYVLGEFLALDVIKAPLKDKHGNVIGTVGCGRDITDHFHLRKLDEKKTRLLEAITDVSEVLSQIDNWDDVLDSVLNILGSATKSDRAYIFQNEKTKDDKLFAVELHEWLAPGAKPLFGIKELACYEYNECLHRWADLFRDNQAVSGSLEDFDEDEQRILKEKNISSLCAVPIFLRNKWWGWIGFDSIEKQEWSDEEARLLKIVATILGGFFYQRELFQFAKNELNSYSAQQIIEEVENRLMLS